jgi:hypothetical protein
MPGMMREAMARGGLESEADGHKKAQKDTKNEETRSGLRCSTIFLLLPFLCHFVAIAS